MSDEEKRKRAEENLKRFEQGLLRRQHELASQFARHNKTFYTNIPDLPGTSSQSTRLQQPTLQELRLNQLAIAPRAPTASVAASSRPSDLDPGSQMGPSVRPKVRLESLPYKSPSTPEIIKKYRNPSTGSPDFEKFRSRQQPWRRMAPQPEGTWAREQAQLNQMTTNQIYEPRRSQGERKSKYLEEQGLKEEVIDPRKGIRRYHPTTKLEDWETSRTWLEPSRRHDIVQVFDRKFRKPVHAMSKPSMKRSMSLPDLSRGTRFGSRKEATDPLVARKVRAHYVPKRPYLSTSAPESKKYWWLSKDVGQQISESEQEDDDDEEEEDD